MKHIHLHIFELTSEEQQTIELIEIKRKHAQEIAQHAIKSIGKKRKDAYVRLEQLEQDFTNSKQSMDILNIQFELRDLNSEHHYAQRDLENELISLDFEQRAIYLNKQQETLKN